MFGIGLGSLYYLSDRTQQMDGFRTDTAITALSFAIVGGVTAVGQDRDVLDNVGMGLVTALVGSLADYERAMNFPNGASPLLWSAVQSFSMSVNENMLLGVPVFSRFGMDLGPGFVSFDLPPYDESKSPGLRFQWRITSTVGAIDYMSRGYEFDLKESLRTGSLVFDADEPPAIDPDGFESHGYAFGNTYAVYEPTIDVHSSLKHCFRVNYEWALPAHEKAHTSQLQKMDIVLYPINQWADSDDQPWTNVTRWLRPAGDIGVAGLSVLQNDVPHDERIIELGPTSLSNEILRREGCGFLLE